ncbi:MAG: preprotein translocase subunit YajC [Tannerellaceae bacterium]|jgi:preprotein translocase subunit YajC|nr:preprotein translocase subunit YajC [Tannerellaceae bacterium]
MNVLGILLDSAAPATTGGSSGIVSFLPIIAIVVIFYFFMIRPQQKRQKDIQKAREAIKQGDRVVTAGGIYGRVKEISDKHMQLEIAEGVRIRIDKNSVFASSEDAQQK